MRFLLLLLLFTACGWDIPVDSKKDQDELSQHDKAAVKKICTALQDKYFNYYQLIGEKVYLNIDDRSMIGKIQWTETTDHPMYNVNSYLSVDVHSDRRGVLSKWCNNKESDNVIYKFLRHYALVDIQVDNCNVHLKIDLRDGIRNRGVIRELIKRCSGNTYKVKIIDRT